MHALTRLSVFFLLSMVCICACKAGAQIPAQSIPLNGSKGGKIVYGQQTGAASQAAVLIKLLTQVHSLCGDKPEIGRVFQFKGTNYVGVFFTVTDRPEGNIPLAGMAIAAATGPNQAEGAMIYDRASSFGTTVNPLLEQLSGVWHPGAASAAASPAPAASAPGQAAGGQTAPAAPLTRFTLSDNTASVGVPAGWQVTPGCAGGTITMGGPHGEVVDLALGLTAEDTGNRFVQQSMRNGSLNGAPVVILPYNTDMARAVPSILDQMRRIGGQGGSSNAQITKAEQMPAQGQRCVHVTGTTSPPGRGTNEMEAWACTTPPGPNGMYGITLFLVAIPTAYAGQERATAHAILTSFQQNTALLKAHVAAVTGPVIAAMNSQIEGQAHQYEAYVNQIGADTKKRIEEGGKQHDAQQRSWEAGQTVNAQNVQGFTNYLLDQSVVQNNITGAQGTLWNNAANALVQANPNKYSYVPNSNINLGSQF